MSWTNSILQPPKTLLQAAVSCWRPPLQTAFPLEYAAITAYTLEKSSWFLYSCLRPQTRHPALLRSSADPRIPSAAWSGSEITFISAARAVFYDQSFLANLRSQDFAIFASHSLWNTLTPCPHPYLWFDRLNFAIGTHQQNLAEIFTAVLQREDYAPGHFLPLSVTPYTSIPVTCVS